MIDEGEFARELLDKGIDKADIVIALRNLLRLKYFPVAIKFLYEEFEGDFKIGAHPYTFCHYAACSRQRGDVLLINKDRLGCNNAKFVFGWKDLDDSIVFDHLKYARDLEQARRFVMEKPRLPEVPIALITAPLHKANFEPDVVYIVCDVLQCYHICVDYSSATDEHPITTPIFVNSAVCGGCVWSYLNDRMNVTPMCSGSYTSGKTEQGEINIFIPWKKFKETVKRLLVRTAKYGGSSLPRIGESYPGFNVCKLCNFLTFKKPSKP